MLSQRLYSYCRSGRFTQERGVVFLFLLALNLAAHYIHLTELGLYDEDYIHILRNLDKPIAHVATLIHATFSDLLRGKLGFEGRPLGLLAVQGLTVTGWNLGGLPGLHIISCLFSTANSYLVYRIFAARNSHSHGFLAALIFTLYPAYALRQYLNAQFWIIPSLTFMLLATKSYLAGKRIVSYVLIAVSLLIYETPTFTFLAIPLLLDEKSWRQTVKRLSIHALITIALMATSAFLRGIEGESRITEMSGYIAASLGRIWSYYVNGTAISVFYSHYHAASYVIERLDAEIAAIIFSAALVLTLAIYAAFGAGDRLVKRAFDDAAADNTTNGGPVSWFFMKDALAGIALIVLSYSSGFFPHFKFEMSLSEISLSGVVSRVHMAAPFGTAVFFSSLFMFVIAKAPGSRTRFAAICFMSALLSMLAGYSHIVQNDYKNGWLYQRCLWSNLFTKAPDMSDGTLILVNPTGLTYSSKYANGFTWYTVLMGLPHIYRFPDNWKNPPHVIIMDPHWSENKSVREGKNGLEINLGPTQNATLWRPVEENNFIYFKSHNNQLERFDGTMRLGGRQIALKQRKSGQAAEAQWPPGALHAYALENSCDFGRFRTAAAARVVDIAPTITRTRSFNGANFLNAALPNTAGGEQFTIELWLRPDQSISFAGGDEHPPTPALIGPLKLMHTSKEALRVVVTTADNKDAIIHDARGLFGLGDIPDWLHIELNVDNGRALLFVNGHLEKEAAGVKVQPPGELTLGKGYLDRFWQGEIADLRISSIVRHTKDFEPEKAAITRDKHTLYLLD